MAGRFSRTAFDRNQLGLDVIVRRPDYSRAGFVVTDANRNAFHLASSFATRQEPSLAIVGPGGAGKTHLIHIIAADLNAPILSGGDLPDAGSAGNIVIDDVERAEPRRLLAIIETAAAGGCKILLAGAGAPADWAHGLRDLATRLEAMPRITLGEPDDALLEAVISRRFKERQWRVKESVARYAAPRIAPTFAAAEAFVAAAGAAALSEGRPINLAVARKVIEAADEGEPG